MTSPSKTVTHPRIHPLIHIPSPTPTHIHHTYMHMPHTLTHRGKLLLINGEEIKTNKTIIILLTCLRKYHSEWKIISNKMPKVLFLMLFASVKNISMMQNK